MNAPVASPASTEHRESTLALAIGALGVVFGDIGTSPLYAMKECFAHGFSSGLDRVDVLGVLSLITWALTLVVSVKYAIFILRADNDGEGGVISLLALVLSKKTQGRRFLLLVSLGLVGTSLLLSEGMITPAISVLGAIEGVKLISPRLDAWILPASTVILVVLFLIQRKGTALVGRFFGPVIILWFLTIGVLGLASIVHSPAVLAAINPLYGLKFFYHHGPLSLLILGSVVLAITGAEALYADIGHFGKKPIRLAWFLLAFPALLLNYFGQGAAILRDGAKALENPFFYLAPSWFLIPLVVIATAAAVIASQALITGAFSIVQQAIQLGYLPKLRIVHTSQDVRGQIYVPAVNFALLVACVLLVWGFKSSSALASAYGISVMGTMLCSSFLYAAWFRGRGVALGWTALLLSFFLTLDLSFFVPNLPKITSGGWFPLVTGVILFTVMYSWKWGSGQLASKMPQGDALFQNLLQGLSKQDMKVARVQGTAVFLLGRSSTKMSVLWHHLKHNKSLHQRVVLLSILTERKPFVVAKERTKLEPLIEGFFEVESRWGYMENPDVREIFKECALQGLVLDPLQVSFFLGRVRIRHKPAVWYQAIAKRIFSNLHRNSLSTVDFFHVPPSRVIEVGTQIEI